MARGQVAQMTSGRPASPSQHTISTSPTPRLASSVSTPSQNDAPSPSVSPTPDVPHVLGALDVDADGQTGGPVGDDAVADLDLQRVDEDDRVHGVERPAAPRLDLVPHTVGDPRHQIVGHVHAVHLGQVRLDVANGHAPRIQGDDLVVEPLETGAALGHDPRLEIAVAVPGHVQID